MAGRPLFLQAGICIIRTNSDHRCRLNLVAAESHNTASADRNVDEV